MRELVEAYQVFEYVFDQSDCRIVNFLHETKDQVHHHGVIGLQSQMQRNLIFFILIK